MAQLSDSAKNDLFFQVTCLRLENYHMNENITTDKNEIYKLIDNVVSIYEEKLRWIQVEENLPKTAKLVIVDSGNDLHACVAVAFYENEEWKYANGQKLWFTPKLWRYFL